MLCPPPGLSLTPRPTGESARGLRQQFFNQKRRKNKKNKNSKKNRVSNHQPASAKPPSTVSSAALPPTVPRPVELKSSVIPRGWPTFHHHANILSFGVGVVVVNNDRFVEWTATPKGYVASTLRPQESREDAPAVAVGEIFVHPLPCLSGAVSRHVTVVMSHKVERGKRTQRDCQEEN